ncbi:fibroblast growth factor receptor 2-like [Ptychodera flava]|uniref:fibroblast growth factor receptor 2-like n=1 Tax=Ptychodera flava TaxID=63121 RepID=UPI003969CC9F
MIGCREEKAPYCIVYEYCPHGNLREYLVGLHKEVKRIDEYELEDVTFNLLCNFASQIASGMAFLGEIECIHRALAARNIQVWHDNVCKISEFGFSSKVLDVNTYEKMIEGRLPVRWMALESILECVYTEKCDVWSFGIVLWEIYNFGKQPYPDMSTKDVIRELQHGYRLPRPHYCDDVVHSIMVECWQDEPGDRPTFEELVTSIGQNYM